MAAPVMPPCYGFGGIMKDTEYTQNVICPYCGYEDRDSWEIDFGESLEGETEIFCGNCGKEFTASRTATIYYHSFKRNHNTVINSDKATISPDRSTKV